jgi:hypothetical protein
MQREKRHNPRNSKLYNDHGSLSIYFLTHCLFSYIYIYRLKQKRTTTSASTLPEKSLRSSNSIERIMVSYDDIDDQVVGGDDANGKKRPNIGALTAKVKIRSSIAARDSNSSSNSSSGDGNVQQPSKPSFYKPKQQTRTNLLPRKNYHRPTLISQPYPNPHTYTTTNSAAINSPAVAALAAAIVQAVSNSEHSSQQQQQQQQPLPMFNYPPPSYTIESSPYSQPYPSNYFVSSTPSSYQHHQLPLLPPPSAPAQLPSYNISSYPSHYYPPTTSAVYHPHYALHPYQNGHYSTPLSDYHLYHQPPPS